MCLLTSVVFSALAICAISAASNKTGDSAFSRESSCPSGWTVVEGAKRCYKVNNDLITWEEAQAHCETLNAALATIPDRETDVALWHYMHANIVEEIFHIGLRYIPGVTGEWFWLDGTKANYTNWYSPSYGILYTPPNPANGQCAQASLVRDGGRWYPEPCGVVKRPSVCELALSSEREASPETDAKPVCLDAVASWKCTSLKAIQACKAAQYFKYLEKNCAKTCGFCR